MKRLAALAALVITTFLASHATGQGFVDMRAHASSQPNYAPTSNNQNYSATSFYGINNLRYGASFQGHRNFLEDSYTNNFMTQFYRDTVGSTDVTNGMSAPGPTRAFYAPGSMSTNGAAVSSGPTLKPADPFGLLPSAANNQAFTSNTNYGRRTTAPTGLYQGPSPTDAQGLPILPNVGNLANQLSTAGSLTTLGETGRLFAPTMPLAVEPPSVFSPQITFYSANEAGMKPPANPTGRILPVTPGAAPSHEPEFNQNGPEQPQPWTMTPNGRAPDAAGQFGSPPLNQSKNGPIIPMPNYQTLSSTADQYQPEYLSQYLTPGAPHTGLQQPGRPSASSPNGVQPKGPAAAKPAAAGEATSAKEPQIGAAKPRPVGQQYYQLALIDLKAGAYRQAAQAFDQVARFDPTLKFEAERGQGLARLLSFDYHAAALLLSKTLIEQPEATGASFRVTTLVANTKDWDAVDADLTAILKDAPASAAHAFDLAYLRIFSGRPQGLEPYLAVAAKNADYAPAVKVLRARIQQ